MIQSKYSLMPKDSKFLSTGHTLSCQAQSVPFLLRVWYFVVVTCYIRAGDTREVSRTRFRTMVVQSNSYYVLLLLALCGDIEINPGPNHSPSLFYMNARSIADHTHPQFNTYFTDNGDYGVICLSETWLHSGVFDGELLYDSLYRVYRCDRSQVGGKDKRGGGVLVAVSRRLISRGREDLGVLQL